MEQFEQLLTCAICLDRYRNPKLLPCQHSFCMEPCMDGLVDYVRRQVKCPECRAEHRIPYQGVQAFPTNVTLQRFLELHIEITGELPDPTSGQTMERCGVCSEKSYCSLCVHCEKKCCPECKDAHMDILRREITRINSQIRRGLHRLQDALALVEKNTLGLQTNCASVAEEVDEIYRRLSKALKDRTEHLRNEIERYSGTEIRGLIQLKENLELEIANIQSNCDLADAHINENVSWDDAELLDTKELFLRTVEFIRNFEYEAGDYGRRVRFVMAHEPNQLVLHVAGYGELNIKPETGSGGHLGTTGGLAPPGGSPGLMRSKSDHRLASQYRQQEEDRLGRNRYVPDYEYDAPEYEAPRNKSRYRSRFMRHRDGEESDGDTRSTVRFSSTPADASPREKVLDTEDAARGPLSGIFRLTDSPRVMKKLQECERAGKRKKEEPAPAQPQAPKPQVQVRKAPTAMAKQVSEDDEISRIKKQNKSSPTQVETVEERQPVPPSPVHTPVRETQEREPDEPTRRTPIARRTSSEAHTPAARSASSDSSTGSESSAGSGIRSTGAPFTAEEMKQKYLSRAPATPTTTTVSAGPGITTSSSRESTTTPTSSPRPFQSRFLGAGNRAAPPPPAPAVRDDPKKKEEVEDDDDDETTSSSEETESETEEESETEVHPSTPTTTAAPSQERQRSESAMARTDIGPLLARSAEARRGSKEDSPSTRYTSPRGSPSLSSPTGTSASSTPGYTSRIVSSDNGVVDDDDATSASSASTDRIVEDNVNALTARDDAGLRDESVSGVDSTVSSDDDSSDSTESSDSDSVSVETVRSIVNVPSNDNKNHLDTLSNVESRDNASSTELNNNKIVDSYANAIAPRGNVKYGMNGDADAIDGKNRTDEEETVSSTGRRNIGPDEVELETEKGTQRSQVDGNGDSTGNQEDEERIDDFLSRVVRDYNRSREDFAGVSGIIGSRVENHRDDAIDDSIHDKTATPGEYGASKNLNIRERSDKAETDSTASTGEAVDSSPKASEGYPNNGNARDPGKSEANATGLDESGERFLARIEEAEESNEADEDNPTMGEEAEAKVGIEVGREATVPESNSDKADEKSTDSSEEESTDTETESDESSVREADDGANASSTRKKYDSDVGTPETRNFVVEKVENLFDDNGWVVAEEETQTGNKRTTVRPSYDPSISYHAREANVRPEETDKTDFYNDDSTSRREDSVETESETSIGNDWKRSSSSRILDSGSTIGSNGWLVSEESGSESEITTSPIDGVPSVGESSHRTDDDSRLDISRMFLSSDEDSLREELRDSLSRVDSTGSGRGSHGDDQSWVFVGDHETENGENDRATDEIIEDGRVVDSSSGTNETLAPRENDFVISNGDDNEEASSRNLARAVDVDDDDNGAKIIGSVSQLRKNRAENGVGTMTRELSSERNDREEQDRDRAADKEDDDETPMNIPMQMVTTVFCVSVLCYSVLTNLFL